MMMQTDDIYFESSFISMLVRYFETEKLFWIFLYNIPAASDTEINFDKQGEKIWRKRYRKRFRSSAQLMTG